MAEKTRSGFGSVVKLTMTLAVSAAAGFAAGVLFAPKSGKETREDVKDISLKFRKDANLYTNGLKNRVGDDLLEFKKNLQEASPMEQVVAKVKKVGNDSKVAMGNVTKSMKKEPKTSRPDLEDSDEFSTDSLLARIQGITADSLED